MSHRRSRYRPQEVTGPTVDVRVGSANSRNPDKYLHVRLSNREDDPARLDGMLRRVVADNPGEPLVIAINGLESWVEDILATCIEEFDSSRRFFHRAVVCTDYSYLPEVTNKERRNYYYQPRVFILDNINYPEVFKWSFAHGPSASRKQPAQVNEYKFRVGVWTCISHAYKADRSIPVALIFTVPQNKLNVHEPDEVVQYKLFPYILQELRDEVAATDGEWAASLFLWTFTMLTSWDNVIWEFDTYIRSATGESHAARLPVRQRTRAMHDQIDKIYDLLQYLAYHKRGVQKLLKQKPDDRPGAEATWPSGVSHDEPVSPATKWQGVQTVWAELEDVKDDLEQYKSQMEAFRERFSNLTDLEFNLSNSKQADDSKFLTGIATLFLPISYLASIWGITTITLSPIKYLYAAVAALAVSCLVIYNYTQLLSRYTAMRFPEEKNWLTLSSGYFTMLGNEVPELEEQMDAVNDTTVTRQRKSTRQRSRSRRKRDHRDRSLDSDIG